LNQFFTHFGKLCHKRLRFEKYRIAVYYKKFKGVFNVEKWEFEKVFSYDPGREITEEVIKYMKRYIMKFLKTATVKVPKYRF